MLHIPYSEKTFRPELDGNEPNSPDPLEFDICPAWGPDMARLKSVVVATGGLFDQSSWTPEMQHSVIEAFQNAPGAFVNTVAAVRNLSVDASMAKRAGIIKDLPIVPNTNPVQYQPQAKVAVLNGADYAKVCSAPQFLMISLLLAMEIVKLSAEANKAADPRFFAQPSGSGETATVEPTTTTVGSARSTSRRRGTAAKPTTAASGENGTSQSR